IIFGQLRLIIAIMDIEEINTDRDKFLAAVSSNVETELKKIGLRLINVNVTDISDESGYIAALGKEAAAKAINDAKKSVAEQERDGSIGQANAQMDQRIKVSEADSIAIQGENEAKMKVAMSMAALKEREAEAQKIATTAEKIQAAKALEESYAAEQAAEEARRSLEKATLEADIIVRTEAKKRQLELEAEAEAEQIRRKAKGEADAIFAKMEAEARGVEEILKKQAAGFAEIVKSAGGDAEAALKLLIADKLEDLMRVQVDAIKNIKIDKVTVWDNGQNKDGKNATAGFISGMMQSVPPLEEVFSLAGMSLPEILGKKKPESLPEAETEGEKEPVAEEGSEA
ncbi:MAG: flotillin family protein, partial [Clostridia bacterium]|nr:flotillin family protein [Clostridia bacterium]